MISGYIGSRKRVVRSIGLFHALRRTCICVFIDFRGASIPQMIALGARTRDGIRSARINKFAKALPLYSGASNFTTLFRCRCGVPRKVGFLFNRYVRSWRFLYTFRRDIPLKNPADSGDVMAVFSRTFHPEFCNIYLVTPQTIQRILFHPNIRISLSLSSIMQKTLHEKRMSE